MTGVEASRLHEVYFYAAEYGIVEHAAAQAYSVNDNTLAITLARGDLRGTAVERSRARS